MSPQKTDDGGGGSSSSDRPQRNRRLSTRAQESESSGVELPGRKRARHKSPSLRKVACQASAASRKPSSAIRAGTGVSRKLESVQAAHENPLLSLLERRGFTIYRWPRAVPQTFPDISDEQRAWKRETDEAEEQLDSEEARYADDWTEFCGCPWMYDDSDMETCIAHTFVSRAKRAFRSGARWRNYEDLEVYEVNSTETAKEVEDPDKRALAMELALDNKVRLAIFGAIKDRLRKEIWLERCDG